MCLFSKQGKEGDLEAAFGVDIRISLMDGNIIICHSVLLFSVS